MADRNDYGPEPFVFDIEAATLENQAYRVTKWTGEFFQLTLMSIEPGDDIGMEVHHGHDQFLRVESGTGMARMGTSEDNITLEQEVHDGSAIFIPSGSFHDVVNTGDVPLKMYSIYAPKEHAHGTVHETKAVAEAQEH